MNSNRLRTDHFVKLLFIGGLLGAIHQIVDRRGRLRHLISDHPVTAMVCSFIAGVFAGGFYLSYRQTTENYKLPSMPEGLIKKWDSPARTWKEVFIKRTRGRVVWQWPVRALKKSAARRQYRAIWDHHCNNPEKTYEELTEHFALDRKTIERALKAGRMGQLNDIR